MGTYTQDDRPLKVTTPLGKDVLLLRAFTGSEGISQLFRFQLDMLAEKQVEIAFDKLLGQKLTIEVALPGSKKRHLNGICNRFGQGERVVVGEKGELLTMYRAEIVPKLWLLTRKAQSRIFQHLSVPDILKKVFQGLEVKYELQGVFHPRDFCVQYRETDFNFASRLMEEEGIYYFFKHSDGNHEMVVANSPGSHPDLPAKSNLIFETVEGGLRPEDRVHEWQKIQELRSGKVTLWDHSFELPHKHLEAEKTIQDSVAAGKVTHKLKVGGNDKLEIYDWPGEYAQRFDGINKGGGEQPAELQKIFEDNQRTVGIRMQEEAAPSVVIQGASACPQIVSGHKFTLERHFNADGPYLVTASSVDASGSGEYRSGHTGDYEYRNTFTCIPFAIPFRPPRTTPKPVVQGTQSAVVVGPPGEEIFTDKYGRIKVQFHWDREGKYDSDSSCWVRVGQPIAGRRWGASFWPRIGQEVIVDFLEGDPDQPIIVGSVYNADQMPPYLGDGPDPKHKKDNKLTGVKSNTTIGGDGFNEWRFDDTKDKEQIFLHAERNMDVRVKSSSMESVGGSKHLTVGGEYDGKRSGDYKELVYQDVHLHNKRHLEQHVGGDMKLLIGGEDGPGKLDLVVKDERKALVEKNDHLHVKGSRMEKIDGSLGLSVGGDLDAKIGKKFAADAGQEIHLKAGMKVIIEAGAQLSLKGPGGFVDIGPTGVTIQGTMVNINSGGAAGSGSGASPAGPTDAKEAAPGDPTVADNAKTGFKSCS
jgi:type VI secretion system secreted protein VgrG